MKKNYLFFLMGAVFFSCNTPADKNASTADSTAVVETEAVAPVVSFPYAAGYSSDWAIGNPENVKVVLELYKAYEEDRIDDFDKYLADTVSSQSYDAKYVTVSKAEAIKKAKDLRSTLKFVSEEFIAFVPLHSNDKNEDWVGTWMKEKVIRKDGTRDSTLYMETWHIRDKKVNYRLGFAQYRGF